MGCEDGLIPYWSQMLMENAGIAQLVEHNLAKVGVASSSLVSRSKFLISQIPPLEIVAGM